MIYIYQDHHTDYLVASSVTRSETLSVSSLLVSSTNFACPMPSLWATLAGYFFRLSCVLQKNLQQKNSSAFRLSERIGAIDAQARRDLWG